MIGLWDTKGSAVVKALAAERRSAGGVTSGLALTLVTVVDEASVRTAEDAATIAAQAHPCRLLIVVRADATHPRSRLDAEIVVGGRLGPCEAVVMRMFGRLALHAESVVEPLLAPDVPVVTWWHERPPERIAYDPLGVVADRRITDCLQADDPMLALRMRAEDYAPGDTDLAWTRITPWRTLVASAFDATGGAVSEAQIEAPQTDPSAALLAGWLGARLGVKPRIARDSNHLRSLHLRLAAGDELAIIRSNGTAILRRTGLPDRMMPLPPRPLGDELAEELRRLDADQPYAAALAAATGVTGLNERPPKRVHVWKDPALAEPPEAADRAAIAAVDAATTEATR
jgi:glucose-6-phosphate dehydrogenase assembly protein OpcA